jgi:hypothetical protein
MLEDGYYDGLDHLFNQDRNEECHSDVGDSYYEALLIVCEDV